MNQLVLLYAQRKRQIVVILATVAVFAFFTFISTWMGRPQVYNVEAVNDGRALHLFAREWPPNPPSFAFIASRSVDGATWSPAIERAGLYHGLAAGGAQTYVLFQDSSMLVLGERADDWKNVRWPLDWLPRGIGFVDNSLLAFGQGGANRRLLTAVFDNGTWKSSASYPLDADNILHIQTVRAEGASTLVWAEAKLPDTGAKGPQKDLPLLPTRVGAARISGGALVLAPRQDFPTDVAYSVTGDASGVHLYFQRYIESVFSLPFGDPAQMTKDYDPVLRVTTLAGGRWSDPKELPAPDSTWLSPGERTVASFGAKTWIFTDEYLLATLYVGVYGRELRGDTLSEPWLVLAPTPDNIATEIPWGLSAIAVAFIVAGTGIAALVARKLPTIPLPDEPLYAAVSDRAMAAAVDFALVYLLLHFVQPGGDPVALWTSIAVTYFVYGTFFEAVSAGQTLGKRLFGLRVVDANNLGPIAFSAALSRNVFKLVEMLTVGVGVCLSTRRYQRPGDFLGGTLVLKELPKFPEPQP